MEQKIDITQKITQKKDIIIFILVILIACLIGYNLVYRYNLSKIDFIKFQIDEEKKKNEILGIIGILDKKLRGYQKRSFSTTEITPVVDKISALAKKTNIKIEAFNPKPAISQEHYIQLPLEIPLSCEYHKLGQFLSLIESSEEFLWVTRLDMKKPTVTDSKQTRVPKIDLELSALYLKK